MDTWRGRAGVLSSRCWAYDVTVEQEDAAVPEMEVTPTVVAVVVCGIYEIYYIWALIRASPLKLTERMTISGSLAHWCFDHS